MSLAGRGADNPLVVRLGRVAATFSGDDTLTVPDIETEWGKARATFNPFWAQVAAELDRLEVCRGPQIVEVVVPATTTTTTTTLPPERSQQNDPPPAAGRTYSKTLTWEHDPPRDPAVSIWGAPWGCYLWQVYRGGRPLPDRGFHQAKVLAQDMFGAYVEQRRNSLTLSGLPPGEYSLEVEHHDGNPSYGYRQFAHGAPLPGSRFPSTPRQACYGNSPQTTDIPFEVP